MLKRVLGLLLAACAGLVAATPPQPNLILITLDTVRADHLGVYGDARAHTPALDALARQGMWFAHAYTTVPLTLPSHAAILTGTYPFDNGVRSQPGFRLGDRLPTLATLLDHAGYATAAVLGSSILDRRFGLARGFQDYDDHIAGAAVEEYAGLPASKRSAAEVVNLGRAWLERERRQTPNKPFFLWLHFYDAHLPYVKRAGFAASYDGEVAYIDSQIGRLIADLKRAGLYDPSAIVVVADHGEGLGDHGESTHGFFIYNSTIHVPLIVKAPAGDAAPAGRRSDEVTSTVDIAPTALRLLGQPVPAEMQGEARLGAVLGQGSDAATPAYAETFFPLLSMGWNPLRALIAGPPGREMKYIQAPRSELYDLSLDPGELHDLAGRERARAASMLAELDDFVRARAPRQAAEARMPVDAATARLFASLGYAGVVRGGTPVFVTDRPDPKDRIHEEEAILTALRTYEAHDYPLALRQLRAILKRDPRQPMALDALGTIQFSQHDLEAARVTYTQLIAAAPYYSTAYAELAHTESLLGHRAAAERLYRKNFALDPSNGRALRELGLLLLEDGKMDEAQADLQRALALQPGDPYALNGLGQIQARQGDFAAAAVSLEKAVAADPKRIPSRLNLGFVYLRLNRPQETARLMQETLRLDSRQPQAYAELGIARLELGDRAAAAQAIRQALSLDPKNSLARQAQQAMERRP
ncbi:MAG: sulfatase-like hydrolase/transferase [Terriglobales bacterium]